MCDLVLWEGSHTRHYAVVMTCITFVLPSAGEEEEKPAEVEKPAEAEEPAEAEKPAEAEVEGREKGPEEEQRAADEVIQIEDSEKTAEEGEKPAEDGEEKPAEEEAEKTESQDKEETTADPDLAQGRFVFWAIVRASSPPAALPLSFALLSFLIVSQFLDFNIPSVR